MDVTPLVKEGAQIVQAYAGGSFRVSGKLHESAIFVTAEKTQKWDASSDDAAVLTVEDFVSLLEKSEEIDVVLLGTGNAIKFLSPALRNTLRDRGLSVDVMDTGAACRTYNVLMAEGRRVVAALLPTS